MSIFLELQKFALEEFLKDFWASLLGSKWAWSPERKLWKNVDFEDPYHENASFGPLKVSPDFGTLFDYA